MDIKIWINPALDLVAVLACALVLWRLRRVERAAAGWAEREARLKELLDGLRGSAAQAEGLAVELDRRLERQATRLESAGRAIGREEPRVARSERPARPGAALASAAEHRREIARLATLGLSAEAIARELELPVAEVRLGLRLAAGLPVGPGAASAAATQTAAPGASTSRQVAAPPAAGADNGASIATKGGAKAPGVAPAESTRQFLPAGFSRVA